jgi:hypothetical protein
MPGYTKIQRNAKTASTKMSVLPAGDYFIGDLSNFLPTDYEKIWKQRYSSSFSAFVVADRGAFIVTRAAMGNGSYYGSNKHTYDGSTISIVSASLCDPELYTGNGTFHSFKEPVTMTEETGVVKFASGSWTLVIDTNESSLDPDYDDGYDSVG